MPSSNLTIIIIDLFEDDDGGGDMILPAPCTECTTAEATGKNKVESNSGGASLSSLLPQAVFNSFRSFVILLLGFVIVLTDAFRPLSDVFPKVLCGEEWVRATFRVDNGRITLVASFLSFHEV